MTTIRINQPLYRRKNRDFSFSQTPLSADFVEPNQETIQRTIDELPVFLAKKSRWKRYSFDGVQQSPLSPDNYESFNRAHTDLPLDDARRNKRNSFQGIQQSPLSANASISEETIDRTITELPLYRNRKKFPQVGFIQSPLSIDAPTSEEAIERTSLELPPPGRFKQSFQGFQATPLPADSIVFADESINDIVVDLPFRARDRNSYSGFLQSPLSADAPIDIPLSWPEEPSFLFSSRARSKRNFPQYLGTQSMPAPANVVIIGSGNTFIPTYRPRRR